MSSLTKVRITLKDPQGRVLAKHPFIVKLLHADIVGVTTVDKPVFSQTGLNGTVILELKPSDYIYSLEYSIRGQRVPAILKFKVPVSADIINIEDIYIDTNYETNDVLALVNELKAIKATVLQMMQEHPDLVTRVNHVANALDNLVSTVTNQGDGIDEILTRLSALDMATDSLIAITDDLVRDKADKYLFTELSTKLDNEVTRITGLINNIVTDLQADKLDLANFKLYIAAKFASIDTDLFKIKTDIVGLKTGQIDKGVFKKTITDELTVKWQNDIKGYDNDVQASLTDIRNVVATADSALAERINTTSAKVDNNTAEITEVRRTYVTKDEAVAFVGDSLRAEWQGDAADMIDKLQIGGRNLIKQSEAMRGVSTVAPDIIPAYNIETGELSRITVYTLSGFVRVTDNVKGVTVGFKNVIDDAQSRISSNLTTVDNEWVFFKYTFATGATTNHKGYVVVNHLGSTDTDLATVETKLMKLEIGVKATDWSPAVTDIDDKITIVEAGLDSFKTVQASKDLAMTERVDNAFSAINDNEASIKTIENTYAKHDEVGAIAKTKLEAEWKGYTDSEINSVVIGGKNYLDDGYFNKGYWQFYGDNLVTGSSAGGKLSMDSQTITGIGEWYLSSLKSKTIGNLASNTKYTISFTGFGSSQYGFMQVNVILRSKQNGVFVTKANLVFNVEDLNTRHVRQISTGNLNNSEEIQLVFQIKNAIGNVWISEAQLELGSKATDWTLAPSDYLDEIADTKASLDEFKQVQASANEALAERMMTAETQLGVTTGKVTSLESSVSTVQGTVTTIQQTMDSNYKDTTAKYNSLANTVSSNQSSTVTSLTELSSRIDNISFNMIIPGKVVNGYIDLTNGNHVVNTANRASDFMDVYAQTTYIIKSEGGAIANVRLAWYNASKAFLSSVNVGTVNGAKTYVAPTNALYARVSWAYADGKNLSVKEVSTAGQVAADLESFKQVQTNKNSAFTNSISSQQTAINNNSSAINTITNTYAKTNEVGAIAKTALQSTWQADAQAKVDALIIGSRNLLLKSDVLYSGTDYLLKRYDLSDASLAANEEVTITIWGDLGTNTDYKFMAYNSGSTIAISSDIPKVSEGIYRITTKWKAATGNNYLNIHAAPNATKAYPITISKIKLERGNKGTDWTTAPEDAITEMATMNSSISSLSQTVSTNQTSTATQIGQLTSNVTSMQAITNRAEGYVENGILYIPSPLGASYSGAAGSNAGAIRISLPTNPINAMIRFTVDIFNYVANTSNSYEISGYVNSTASPWLQNTAICAGAANRAFPVRFGTDNTGKACVWIGNLDSTWSYCRVKVRDLTVGYANLNKELWRQGWNITFVTTYNTVNATVNPFNGEKAAADVSATLDTYKTTQAAVDSAQTLEINAAKSAAANAMAAITVTNATVASQGSAIAAQETTLKAAINNASKGSAFASDFKDPSVWYSHYGTNISANFRNNLTSSPSNPYAYYSGTGNDFNYSTQVINIEAGHKYKFSAWFYNGAGNGSFGFNWKRQGTLNNYAGRNVTVTSVGEWQYKEAVVTAAVLGDWAIQPGFYVNHTGTTGYGCIALYKFEDITLEESVKAQWTVTTEAVGARKAVAGLSLGVNGNTGESTFLVKANKFEIADSNNVVKAAFINNGLNPELVLDGSLSAQKVRIGIGANLVPDPFWEGGLSGAWRPWSSVANISLLPRASAMISVSCPATRVIRYSTGSTATSVSMFSHTEHYQSEPGGIPVVAGEQYKVSLDFVRSTSPASAGRLRVVAYFYTQTGGTDSVDAINILFSSFSADVWVLGTNGSFTVPAAAVKMRLCVYAESMTGTFDWCNPAIMKMVDGSLVVNGSITANEIAAEAIGAQHLTVGSVTTEKLTANIGITSPTINGGTVTGSSIVGGNLNIGSGVFTVDSQGNVTLTKGQINIANNFIVDTAGNLTAKSGRFEGNVFAENIDGIVSLPIVLPFNTVVALPTARRTNLNLYVPVLSAEVIKQTNIGMVGGRIKVVLEFLTNSNATVAHEAVTNYRKFDISGNGSGTIETLSSPEIIVSIPTTVTGLRYTAYVEYRKNVWILINTTSEGAYYLAETAGKSSRVVGTLYSSN